MIENLQVTVTANDRTASFILTFDSEFESDRDMRTVINRDGACEPEIVHLMHRVLQPDDVVVDGGANVGFFTCLMSQLVGKSGLVYAVEPAPANIRKLEHNLANNKVSNVRVVKSPLYSSHAEVTLHLAQHTGFNSLEASEHTVGRMKTVATTIDAMLDGQVPKLIKLDIEGAELHALMGATVSKRRTFSGTDWQCPYIVVEVNQEALKRFGHDRKTIRKFLEESGYEMWILQIDGRFPLMVPRQTELVSDRMNQMVLFSTPEHVAKAWPKLEMV